MKNWYMLTVVGADRAGIVARLTRELFDAGAYLGEASMLRLGGNFTIMLMVCGTWSADGLRERLSAVAGEWGLRVHVDAIEGGLHQHVLPDVRVHVHGADRVGIVAEVTEVLARLDVNILSLDSDVGGVHAAPFYVMQIEGVATAGVGAVEAALEPLRARGIDVRVETIETLVG
ncbi:glycine cleavage system protein R [Acidihalobacter ferrooxydans]|uniref:Amino acid-binding protein n=1 Tax=Acidihalobacter ferrooxydans TaxID=1765967 RepID=A0A1P8UGD2_9GAMM|nr:ACT domain-containing protein [Acidihalobacter ferrooxydans]APZ42902.1 amino acid-binding protein [Acidihalobacter ferrooxydans]